MKVTTIVLINGLWMTAFSWENWVKPADACKPFARKLQQEWSPEIERGQTVDEQWIVPVGGLPNNSPRNSAQPLNKDVCFHCKTCYTTGSVAFAVRSFVKILLREILSLRAARPQRRLQ